MSVRYILLAPNIGSCGFFYLIIAHIWFYLKNLSRLAAL